MTGKAHYLPTEEEVAHVPSLDTSEGVLGLFSICALTELSNVLSLQTYSQRGMPPDDREHCVQARHRSRDLLYWLFANYEFVRPGVESFTTIDGQNEVYWPYVVRIVKGLLRYKELAADSIHDSVEGCTATAVKKQIDGCFRGVTAYHAATSFWGKEPIESLAWPTDDQHAFIVRAMATPKPCQRESRLVYYLYEKAYILLGNIDGLTADDKMVRSRLLNSPDVVGN